jgi:transposase
MSVYVGIDVHRKRSQVAVVTEDGMVQLNRTWSTDRSRCCD